MMDGPVMIREGLAKLAKAAKDIAAVRQVHGKGVSRIRTPQLLQTGTDSDSFIEIGDRLGELPQRLKNQPR